MGSVFNLYGSLPGRARHGYAHRYFLLYSGYRVDLHARADGYCSGPMDSGAEVPESMPPVSRSVHGRCGCLWSECRRCRAVRSSVHTLCTVGSVLHADDCADQLGCVQRAGKSRYGYGERFPADKGVWYGRIHRHGMVRRSDGIPSYGASVCGQRRSESAVSGLFADAAELRDQEDRRQG